MNFSRLYLLSLAFALNACTQPVPAQHDAAILPQGSGQSRMIPEAETSDTPWPQLEWGATQPDYMVENLNDSGPGSLRHILLNNNKQKPYTTIFFKEKLSGKLHLASELIIRGNVLLVGPAEADKIIDLTGDSLHGVLVIDKSSVVSIRNLTISEGNVHSGEDKKRNEGAGIYNLGSLYLDNVILEKNSATRGGGISNKHRLSINNSVIRNNIADKSGGGVRNTGLFFMKNSKIVGNRATSEGGGVYNKSRFTAVDSQIVENNRSSWGDGNLHNTYYGKSSLINTHLDRR